MRVVAPAVIFAFLLVGGAMAYQCYEHDPKDCTKENCLADKKDCQSGEKCAKAFLTVGKFK